MSRRRYGALSSVTQSLIIQKSQLPVKVRDRSVSRRETSVFSSLTWSNGSQFFSTSSAPSRQLRVTELFLLDELRSMGI
ncbi:hypothetical protein HAX54_007105, partial [Datura stramonium]|nr:hypothetical protein [Datura stramonium]